MHRCTPVSVSCLSGLRGGTGEQRRALRSWPNLGDAAKSPDCSPQEPGLALGALPGLSALVEELALQSFKNAERERWKMRCRASMNLL